MQTLANQITVKVTGDNNGGSGTLLAKQGNSYLVLTNAHVVRGVNKINLATFDGKTYSAEIVSQSKFEKSDLALLKFQANQSYCVPDIAESINNITGREVIAAGYSGEKGKIVFRSGEVKLIPDRPLKEGYQIGYSSDIDQGMSGGAILSSDGTLIGINGISAYPILNTGYVDENRKKPTDAEIQEMRKVSWGIPISIVLAEVNERILTAYNLPLPKAKPTTPKIELTGWLGELEQKAKQFTVRIDSSSGTNGSGVIIAKSGDTYTVLTAAHVLCESENGVNSCPSYEVMTDDGEKYSVEKNTIQTKEGVDLGILKFKSQRNYQVATLADYNPNTGDYIFTVGYPKLGNESPWRFSSGLIFDKETGLLYTRESDFQSNSDGKLQTASQILTSLTGGYELVYTSITYGGMSGGAVLDSQGRVIGIHGRSEGEEASDEKIGDCGVNSGCKVQIGYSLGIPISTFLGQKFDVQVQKVKKTPAQQLTAQQKKSIQEAVLSADFIKGNAKASQWLERGNQLWRLRRYEEAVKAFDQAIKQQPKSNFIHLAYYGKGLALGAQGKHQDSVTITAFEQAVKLKPGFVAGWTVLSAAYRELNQSEKALLANDKAIQLQPKNPNLYNQKFLVLNRLQRYIEAETAINKAIEIAPRAAFYFNRSLLYYEQKKWELALDDYNKAIQINSNDAKIYNNRGVLYDKQEKWELALADYNKTIQINPNLAQAYYNRGNIYSEQRKWKLALADYNKAIQINPNYANAYNNRGNLYYEQKKWELALSDFKKTIQINPNNASAYYNRGVLYYEQRKWELALSDFKKAIQINSNYVNAYYNRAKLYKKQKKWKLALADYNKVIQISPNHAQAYNNRGNLYSEYRIWDLALADYTKAIQINPNNASTYNNRGIVYDEQKKWELALSDYNKAIQINPNLASAYYNRGLLYQEQKKWELALDDYNKVIQINPNDATAYNKVIQMMQKLKQVEN
ncbi:MAG: tetratricopeptide repeat protein [Richelia sp. RM2_1_2]|nr:tetratricopeptide repeat protein [Richelia sp. RM2_1_2]